jgi:hypothetical protein
VRDRNIEPVTELLGWTTSSGAGPFEIHPWVGGTNGLSAPQQGRVPVATDLLTQLPTFVGCRRLRDGVAPRATEALLDPVLAQQGAEFGA